MMYYSIEPKGQIFVKGYGILSFPENICKNVGKNISKNLSSKYSPVVLTVHQKRLHHPKQSTTEVLKTASKRAIQKTAEATGDLIGNKICN